MSSGTFIVKSALQKIGAHSIVAPADSESIEKGLAALNSMMQLWVSWGIDLSTIPLKSAGDDLNEPPDTTNAIINNLAIEAAPYFDNGESIVSDDLRLSARNGFSMVKSLYQTFTIPKKRPSSTLPMGAGNSQGIWRRRYWGNRDGGLGG